MEGLSTRRRFIKRTGAIVMGVLAVFYAPMALAKLEPLMAEAKIVERRPEGCGFVYEGSYIFVGNEILDDPETAGDVPFGLAACARAYGRPLVMIP